MHVFISFDKVDRATVLRIDRPPANAMDLELLEELVGAFRRIAADPPAALILSGREGFFSAGVDLKAVPAYNAEQNRRMVAAINDMVLASYPLPFPVIAAVTGHAIAGGLVLALCADIRIASMSGRYGLTEVKVGVPYPQAALGVVRTELPPHAARRLVFDNRLISAQECVRLGVVDEALAAEQVLGRAIGVANEMSAFPNEVYARTKLELRGAAWEAMRTAARADPLLADRPRG